MCLDQLYSLEGDCEVMQQRGRDKFWTPYYGFLANISGSLLVLRSLLQLPLVLPLG